MALSDVNNEGSSCQMASKTLFWLSLFDGLVMARSAGDNGRRCFIQINTRGGNPVSTPPETIEEELRPAVC